ncbi:MAG: FMN-binding negative transcriptional regulator [Betaproteobacteria bacterium]|nr:FMN-binding negative transcriptional regulator [Betaproteobacteria bacterium]MBA3775950.1 FMN-binding negative transcriptional regulator [Betaproteobacteria bacterium]
MSLYTPAHFAGDDRAAVARLMHDHPFATLITPGSPEPLVSHVPLLLVPGCEPHGTLIGHFARANPHWRAAHDAHSIAIFLGPHAYVSPSWYTEPARMVPTWNYAVVHARGMLEVVDDAGVARGTLDLLIQRFETGRPAPWRFERPPAERDALVGGIVAFRLRIKRIDVKFKLSQNRSREDQLRVIAALQSEGYADATATAAWMQEYAIPAEAKASGE